MKDICTECDCEIVKKSIPCPDGKVGCLVDHYEQTCGCTPESFSLTNELRVMVKSVGINNYPREILQQKLQGDKGNVRWEDVSKVFGEQTGD